MTLAHLIPVLCRLLAISCMHAPNPEAVVNAVPRIVLGHFALVRRAVAEGDGKKMRRVDGRGAWIGGTPLAATRGLTRASEPLQRGDAARPCE